MHVCVDGTGSLGSAEKKKQKGKEILVKNYLYAISDTKEKRNENVSYDNYVLIYNRLHKEIRGS
jgi:hypothetical protein